MGKRGGIVMKRTQQLDFETYYDAKFRSQMDEAILAAVERLTGRDLYNQSTVSGTSKYLINRPVNYALHGTEVNYSVDPQKVMRDCLIDGRVVLRVGDPEHIKIQEHVHTVQYGSDGKPDMIRIQYAIQNPNDQRPDAVPWLYREEWYRWWNGERTGAWVYVYNTVQNEDDFVVIFDYEFPYWPFVSIGWVDNESFLDCVKKSVIRLEGVTINIETENVRHSGRKLFIVGMKRGDNKRDPRDTQDRINYLPEGAEAYYVDVDTGGVSLMFEEQEKVETFIERTTGVISIKQLAGLSGDSRQIAETPLVHLAEEIRLRFENGMAQVVEILQDYFGEKNVELDMESPDLEVNHRFLRIITDKGQHLDIIDRAVERGAITNLEEIIELRRLLNLSHKDPALLPAAVERESKETGNA